MLHFEELTWPELEALDRVHTVVFVVLSPLEEHGPHLPLGTDLYTGRGIAEAIALRLEQHYPQVTCVLLPAIPLGSGAIPYLGTIGTPVRLVRQALFQAGKALARDGFHCIIAVSGHLGLSHLSAMEAASKAVSRRYGITMVAPVAGIWHRLLHSKELGARFSGLNEPIVGQALKLLLRAHHSGSMETSLMLHLHPELVNINYQHLKRVDWWHLVRWRGWTRAHWPGYVGDPTLARADVGQVMVEMMAQLGADLAARMVEEQVQARQAAPLTSRNVLRPKVAASLLLIFAGLASGVAGLLFWKGRRGHPT
ncbi:MAG TPA: creatininase family protein [Ktedonobacterales bacterium]